MRHPGTFCVIGYSTRALCQACNRINIRPISVDAFADHDCQLAAATSLKTKHWETQHDPLAAESIVHSLSSHGNPKILLGGGTENWPFLIQLLHQKFETLGPTHLQLLKLRDPCFWYFASQEAGIYFPVTICQKGFTTRIVGNTVEHRLGNTPVHDDKPTHLLSKPYAGAGGIHVAKQSFEGGSGGWNPGNEYLQEQINGRIIGAHCILSDFEPELLGVTEAFGECDWPGPTPFIYRGSWGPQPVLECENLTAPILKLANVVRDHTGLRGWVQFDFVETPTGELWLLEVNPRWAAGMELIVESERPNPVARHLNAFAGATLQHQSVDVLPNKIEMRPHSLAEPCLAKAILYAPRAIKLRETLLGQLHQLTDIADVPAMDAVGQVVEQGHPLLTVKASLAPTVAAKLTWPERKQELLAVLHQRAEQIIASC